jgi:hypothetical protein
LRTPLKDELLQIIKDSLTRDGVSSIQKIVQTRFLENPWFCGTLDMICEWLLDRWDDQAIPTVEFDRIQALLLKPLRLFIESHDQNPPTALDAASALFVALSKF